MKENAANVWRKKTRPKLHRNRAKITPKSCQNCTGNITKIFQKLPQQCQMSKGRDGEEGRRKNATEIVPKSHRNRAGNLTRNSSETVATTSAVKRTRCRERSSSRWRETPPKSCQKSPPIFALIPCDDERRMGRTKREKNDLKKCYGSLYSMERK